MKQYWVDLSVGVLAEGEEDALVRVEEVLKKGGEIFFEWIFQQVEERYVE